MTPIRRALLALSWAVAAFGLALLLFGLVLLAAENPRGFEPAIVGGVLVFAAGMVARVS